MTEVNTFSAAVDDCIVRTGRPGNRADVIAFVRQAMRESQVLVKPAMDLVEDSLPVSGNNLIWDLPEYFREMRAVKYPFTLNTFGQPVYPKHIQPSRFQEKEDFFYYRTGSSFAFSGINDGGQVDVAYLTWFRKLPYYEVAERPATFSLETGEWSYLAAASDEEKQVARDQVTNWLLFDWYDLVLEGACAKMWKMVADQRAGPSFALFKSLQKDFVSGTLPDSYSGSGVDGR